ncbi:GGDEF domain-containing protein [Butyrivibrio sp. VCB2001]|uniref:GGDEF domain-containing protein n=1 Tax=Butyrivibrio sp. VCB2001 TaxID=1280667 RepID=UPI00047898B8|nr:GGDEF domain-containing protein [Butyrivibrio sp. VCB2001]
MIKAIKNYFFPTIDRDVRELMDQTSTRNIKNVSLVVAVFETLTLLFFVLSRKSFGHEEWLSIGSVLFCIITCLSVFFVTRYMLSRDELDHLKVELMQIIYYILMSLWSMWGSYRRYERGEQILTFYACEVMLVCFIVLKPWTSTLMTLYTYVVLYSVILKADGGSGINTINFSILVLVSAIGMGMRFHSLRNTSEATVKLEKSKNSEIQDKMNILQSIADIYDKVNLIDFNENTEMSVRDKDHVKYNLDLSVHKHTVMSTKIREKVMPDQLDDFIAFTDISTVRERLVGKRLLSEDFIDVVDGWFRAQYIPVEVDDEGMPTQVVFTTRNVDDERQREERLVRIAMTDELTRLFNRRSYEEDLAEYEKNGLDKDFVILSADVNGLKRVNDTMGHAGGDELLKGAAECLLLGIASKGKVYRIGGDEFAAILHTGDPEEVKRDIESYVDKWSGQYSDKLSISIGYATHADNESLDIVGLEKKADNEMYQAKARYYATSGIDRRTSSR